MKENAHRIVTLSHGHPDFYFGGGEIAAYNLYKAYAASPKVDASFFIGRHEHGNEVSGSISLRRPGEYLWHQSVKDFFIMKAANTFTLRHNFTDLIQTLRPTIFHAHHYVHLGLEYLYSIKKIEPSIRILMTLHEYMAICANSGQMIKPSSGRLCFRESPEDCVRCYPERRIEDFWLRKHRYRSFFRLVDHFIAPSDFLRQRYIDWGIAPERITTIENGQATHEPLPPRALSNGETRNRFGFFGQINPYKGVDLLLKALASLKKSERRGIVLEIHGANLESQKPEFQQAIHELRAPLEKEGALQWVGPYEPCQLASRMGGVDWVVMPSVWWENSPLVIQEAFLHGRPPVVSDIGGMAEKVRHGIDGWHVPVGSIRAWADTLRVLAEQTDEWDKLREAIKPPIGYEECAEAHLAIM
jgi:glycosyltransferase involved in cell wall biosynthesis